MTKKEICVNSKTFGYHSSFGGIELKNYDFQGEGHIFYTANSWYGKKSYHKARLYIGITRECAYFMHKGVRIYLDDCIKVDI